MYRQEELEHALQNNQLIDFALLEHTLSPQYILEQQEYYEKLLYNAKEKQIDKKNFKQAMQQLQQDYYQAIEIENVLLTKCNKIHDEMLDRVKEIRQKQEQVEQDKYVVQEISREKEKILRLIDMSRKRIYTNEQTINNLMQEVKKLQLEAQTQILKNQKGQNTEQQLDEDQLLLQAEQLLKEHEALQNQQSISPTKSIKKNKLI